MNWVKNMVGELVKKAGPKSFECCYLNESQGKQLVRLCDSLVGLERILEPGKSITFQAQCESVLEIYDFQFLTAMLSERIVCTHLVANDCHSYVMKKRWGTLDQASA